MNPSLKLSLYVVTAVGTLVFGLLFAQSWRRLDSTDTGSTPAPATATARAATPTASSPAANTGGDPTREVGDAVVDATNVGPAETGTSNTNLVVDGVGTATPEAGGDDEAGAGVEPPSEVSTSAADREAPIELARPSVSGRGWARLLLWGLLGFASVAGLGSLIAYDVTQYAGNRATESLFDDEGDGLPPSIDDEVEKVFGEGDYLGAIRLLREHLTTHPKAYEAQIRIAEIYEKELNNTLAAALEYEELLKGRLPVEKRGWTSIHLVNLYNRMDKPDQAVACLQRIVLECPGTAAANKARERLEAAGLEVPEPPQPSPESAEEPPSNLPPGFRPKGS